MFYDVFLSLCDVYGTTPVEVRKKLGISQSTMASWKSRGLTPSAGMAVRLANYFGVSVDYLLGYEDMIEKPYDTYDTYNREKILEALEYASKRDRLNAAYELLNDDGQQEAVKRVEELTEIPRYRTEAAPQSPPAPQEGTDTTPPLEGAEGPGEGE